MCCFVHYSNFEVGVQSSVFDLVFLNVHRRRELVARRRRQLGTASPFKVGSTVEGASSGAAETKAAAGRAQCAQRAAATAQHPLRLTVQDVALERDYVAWGAAHTQLVRPSMLL